MRTYVCVYVREEFLENIRPICPICPLSHLIAHGSHLLSTAPHNDIATDTTRLATLETQFPESTAYHHAAQLLRDISTDNLHGHSHADELAGLDALRATEILTDKLDLQTRCLKLLVMARQALYLRLREPVAETLAVERIGLAVDATVVQRILVRRLYRLHLEGQPAAVARRVSPIRGTCPEVNPESWTQLKGSR